MTYCSVLSRKKEGWSRDRLVLMIRLLTQVHCGGNDAVWGQAKL